MSINTQLVSNGVGLMLTGMGTVFSFLLILWFAVSQMGKIVIKLNEIFPEQVAAVKTTVKQISDDTEIAIAIAMAKLHK